MRQIPGYLEELSLAPVVKGHLGQSVSHSWVIWVAFMIFAASTTNCPNIYSVFFSLDNLTFHSFNLASSLATVTVNWYIWSASQGWPNLLLKY